MWTPKFKETKVHTNRTNHTQKSRFSDFWKKHVLDGTTRTVDSSKAGVVQEAFVDFMTLTCKI